MKKHFILDKSMNELNLGHKVNIKLEELKVIIKTVHNIEIEEIFIEDDINN